MAGESLDAAFSVLVNELPYTPARTGQGPPVQCGYMSGRLGFLESLVRQKVNQFSDTDEEAAIGMHSLLAKLGVILTARLNEGSVDFCALF